MSADDQEAFIYIKRFWRGEARHDRYRAWEASLDDSTGSDLKAMATSWVMEPDHSRNYCVVSVDGWPVCSLCPGGEHRQRVAPGQHVIQVLLQWGDWRRRTKVFAFEVLPGETVKAEIVGGVFRLRLDVGKPVTTPGKNVYAYSEPDDLVQVAPTDSSLTMRDTDFVETHRTQEAIGEDSFSIDNRNASTAVERVRAVSQEWSRSGSIAFDQARTADGAIATGPSWLSFQAKLQLAFQQKYSVDTTEKRSVTDQITVPVPAGAGVTVIIAWKLVWQWGMIRFADHNGQIVEVPYKVAINLTFDQIHKEIV